jgi:predicted Zn-dependent peptidase
MALESNRIDEAYYNRFLAQIDALTAEEVAAAIARYLDAGEYIRIQVGNIPAQT